MQHEFSIKTSSPQQIIDLTKEVKKLVSQSKIKEGICLVYAPHATCAVIINENYDLSVCDDILSALNKLVPLHAGYKHDKVDNNAAAHIKSAIIGPSETISVKNGNLQLGTWQGIALTEFDGPRERKIIVKIIKG